MIVGHVRAKFPRVLLTLAGVDGPITIEFLVDTVFDGALKLPPSVIQRLDAVYVGTRRAQVADGALGKCMCFEVEVMWDGDRRIAEVLVFDGEPLLDVDLLEGCLLQVEVTDGGEVTIESA